MQENPFMITERVVPRYFCDRKKESEQLIRYITNRNNVVLISPRRIGKTGLIQYCYGQPKIKDNYITFYIDILSTNNLQEFVFVLGKRIYSKLQPLGEKVVRKLVQTVKSLSTKIGFDAMTGLPVLNFQLGDITNPEHTLEEIFEYLNTSEKRCIVAIDEFQQISKYPEKGVEALIRSHLLEINNCNFIFSGSEHHLLSEMFIDSSRPFYQSSSILELSAIPEEIYCDFIVEMFKFKNKYITREMAEEIYRIYEGNTFCIQKICNVLFSLTPEGGEPDDEMLQRAEEEVLYSYDTLFRERLNTMTQRQKELLFALAAEGKVEQIVSTDFIRRNSLSSVSSVQSSLKSLMNNGVVGKEGRYYLINDRFMARWLRINYCY